MAKQKNHDTSTRIIVDVYHDGETSDSEIDLAVYTAIEHAIETIEHFPLRGALIETEAE